MAEFHKLYKFMQLPKESVISFFDNASDEDVKCIMDLMKQYQDYCMSIGDNGVNTNFKVLDKEVIDDIINHTVDDFLRGMGK